MEVERLAWLVEEVDVVDVVEWEVVLDLVLSVDRTEVVEVELVLLVGAVVVAVDSLVVGAVVELETELVGAVV